MPISARDETSTAADRGRGASAPLPREGSRDEVTSDTNAAAFAQRRPAPARPIIGLVLIAALAGALFTWSVDNDPTVSAASPLETLRSSLDDDPDDAGSWQQLGDLYLLDATANDDLAAYLAAVDALERSASISPANVETTRSLAVASVGLHRFDDAAQLAAVVLAERPTDRVALAAMVDAQVELGRYDDAILTADRLAGLRPDAVSLARLSYVNQITGKLDAAVDTMYAARTAAQGSPAETARLSIFLAELQRLQGNRSLAASLYAEATSNDAAVGRAKVGLAQLAAGDGDFVEAQRILDEPGVATTGLTALQTIARLGGATGDEARLTQALEQVRAVVDGSIAADIGVEPSEVLLEADFGDQERANRLADLVLAAQPNSVYAHHAVAWTRYLDGDVTAASSHIDLALRTGLRDPLMLAHAALIREAMGDHDLAVALLDEATSIDTGVIRAYDGLTPDMFSTIDRRAGEATP